MSSDPSPQLPPPLLPAPGAASAPAAAPAPAVQPPAFIARPSGPFPSPHAAPASADAAPISVSQTRFVKKQLASLFILIASLGVLIMGASNPEALQEQDSPAATVAVGLLFAVVALLSLRAVIDRSTVVVTATPGVVTIEFRRRFTGSTVRTVTVDNLKSVVLLHLRSAGFKMGSGYEIKTRGRWSKTRVDPRLFSVPDQAKLKRMLNNLLAEQVGMTNARRVQEKAAMIIPHG